MHLSPDVYYVTGAFLIIILIATIYNFYRSPERSVSSDRLFMLASFTIFALALFIEGWARISSAPQRFKVVSAALFVGSMWLGFVASVHTYRQLKKQNGISARRVR